jgi:phage terminase large subunit-like protein
VRSLAEAASVARIALVGPTAADVRDVMVEGSSGLLAIAPNSNRPIYEPSKRRLAGRTAFKRRCSLPKSRTD